MTEMENNRREREWSRSERRERVSERLVATAAAKEQVRARLRALETSPQKTV